MSDAVIKVENLSKRYIVRRSDLKVSQRRPGISGYMRVRNEEQFLALAIESHLPIPEKINSIIRIVRNPWLHPRYHFPTFNCFLGYRGLNLWDQNGKFFVNLREPVTEYHGLFPVSERTWFRHDPRWEVLESGHLRRLEICHYGFYHVRFVKVGREQDLKGYPPPDINLYKDEM